MPVPTFEPDLILVVDDVPENRQLATLYLEKLGWRTVACESAEQALRQLARSTPSHILLDIKMPGMDGISLARAIRQTLANVNTRIVGYTAHALKDEVQRILDAGFDQVLIKPVTYKDMSDCFGTQGVVFL
ncbi:MAG: response regulator [Hydrogenophaga sp.]|jgi:CheY-like chemotaxis protein|nr:response regulator [Hydrogenophaga sp.]